MADTVTLTELEGRVRLMSDTQNQTLRHTQADIWDYINRGIKHFHAEVLRTRGQGLFQASGTFNTVAAQELYALPAQFLSLTKVWTLADGRERVFRPYEESETQGIRDNQPWDNFRGFPGYRIIGDSISLRPTPSTVYAVNYRYVMTQVKLTTGANFIDGFCGFDEFVVAWATRRIAFKDNRQDIIALCTNDMAQTIELLRATVRDRNQAPVLMTDTRGNSMADHYGRIWRGYRGY